MSLLCVYVNVQMIWYVCMNDVFFYEFRLLCVFMPFAYVMNVRTLSMYLMYVAHLCYVCMYFLYVRMLCVLCYACNFCTYVMY